MKALRGRGGPVVGPGSAGPWIGVNAAAYVVVVVGGVALELLASNTTRELASDHRVVAVVLVAVIGAGFHGLVLGRWQWRILVTRMPGLISMPCSVN